MMKGRPGKLKPATLKSSAFICSSYHVFGMECCRCMSLESNGLPDAVCAPLITQSLEPGTQLSHGNGVAGDTSASSHAGASSLTRLLLCGPAGGGGGMTSGARSTVGGWSRHEEFTYRSAACSGVNLAEMRSRCHSVCHWEFRVWLILMPMVSESSTVQGRGV